MADTYEWKDEFPVNDGHFFYTGELPDGSGKFVGIAEVFTNKHQERGAAIFFPPTHDQLPKFVMAKAEEWTGQWSGPDYGLVTVTANTSLTGVKNEKYE
jgi:hypothetical protein